MSLHNFEHWWWSISNLFGWVLRPKVHPSRAHKHTQAIALVLSKGPDVSTMVAYGRLTWLPSPWDEVRNVGEKPTKFLLKVSISAGKRVDGFWVFSFYAENCGEMSGSAKRGTNGAMEQWYQKKIHMFCNNRSNSICRVFWEKCVFFVDYFASVQCSWWLVSSWSRYHLPSVHRYKMVI